MSCLCRSCSTSRSFLARPPDHSVRICPPATVLVLLRTGSCCVPFRKPRLTCLLLVSAQNPHCFVLRLFLPQLLSHSLSNCPNFLLLFSPILMGLEDRDSPVNQRKKVVPLIRLQLLPLRKTAFLSVFLRFIGVRRLILLAYLENKHLPFASFSLTTTSFFCFTGIYVYMFVCFFLQ